jgi:hypothetical protein
VALQRSSVLVHALAGKDARAPGFGLLILMCTSV